MTTRCSALKAWLKPSALLVAAATLAGSAALAPRAFAEEEEDAFGGIAHTTFYMIKEVTMDPAAPKAGQKVKVMAKLALSSDEEENSVKAATVFHRAGAANTSASMKITMGGTGGSEATLEGEITAAAGKNQVWLSIKDQYGNITTEGPAIAGAFPPKAADMLPGGSDIDNPADIVPDDMDIVETAVAYDDKYLYTYFKVQGKISGGTIDPPQVNIYGTKVTNPDVDEGEGLLIGKVLGHAPLAPEIAKKFEKQLKENNIDIPFESLNLAILDLQKLMEDPKSGFKIGVGEKLQTNGGELFGAMPLEIFGENKSGILRAISLGIANASVEALVPIPYNCSHFTQLYRRTHDFDG